MTSPIHELKVLYEDNHLIAVYKPHGVLTQGDSSGELSLMDIVKEYLKNKYGKPGNVYLGLVHRLDKGTGGVVLFAKTSKAASRLSESFRERDIEKMYEAWVEGEPPRAAEWSDRIQWDDDNHKAIPSEDGKIGRDALLGYEVEERKRGMTRVRIRLHTGRKHQIRFQFSRRGFPVVGDRKYGASQTFPDPGIALACVGLVVKHPTQKNPVAIMLPRGLRFR